jgi:hypothetical protein
MSRIEMSFTKIEIITTRTNEPVPHSIRETNDSKTQLRILQHNMQLPGVEAATQNATTTTKQTHP